MQNIELAVIAIVLLTIGYAISNYNKNRRMARVKGHPPATIKRDGFLGFKIAYTMKQKMEVGLAVDESNKKYGELPKDKSPTFQCKVAGLNVIQTADPENIKALLATQFNDFDLGLRHAQFFPLLGDGIFTLDGQGWKHSRTMLRPQFAREQVSHVQMLEPHIKVLMKHIQNHNGVFDLQELFFRLTVDSATEFLFGESVESLRDASVGYVNNKSSIDGRDKFAKAFNSAQIYLAQRNILQRFYWLLNPAEFRANNADVHQFADYYVNYALNTPTEELEAKSKGAYIFLYELAKHTRDPKVLRDQSLNILLAGRDTTAGLLSFTFFELARNKEVYEKLRREIVEAFGEGEDARISEISFESLKRCEYLKAVLSEILRLYPSVPMNLRFANKDTTLPRGGGEDGTKPLFVPKGGNVMYSVFTTHRSEEYYGKDAHDFRPERWFEPETRKLGWAYVPFNGGPRICLGQQFALTEASYVVVRLLQEFTSLGGTEDAEYPPRKMSHLTMCLYEGCNVIME